MNKSNHKIDSTAPLKIAPAKLAAKAFTPKALAEHLSQASASSGTLGSSIDIQIKQLQDKIAVLQTLKRKLTAGADLLSVRVDELQAAVVAFAWLK